MATRIPTFVPTKVREIKWDSFNGGWNNLYKPTELRPNELAQADNLLLVGKGTPTGRWGSVQYANFGTNPVRLLDGFYNSAGSINQLLAVTDDGYLYKKSGASYSMINGMSFASGFPFQSTELGGNLYIANSPNFLVKYNGTNLVPYVGLSRVSSVSAAFMSGATGSNAYSWVITAQSQTGETVGSDVNTVVSNLPLSLASTYVRVTWGGISAAPSMLTGYNIYRGFSNNDARYVANVGPSTNTYIDTGDNASDTILSPETDTTYGPRAKYIIKLGDRTVLAGFDDDPSAVLISGKYPLVDRYTAPDGGGICRVSPDDGDVITGLGVQRLQTTTPLIVVYKKNATYVIAMDQITFGQELLLDPHAHLLSSTSGAANGDVVIPVENDVFAFGRKGLYSTGQEPQFLNQIRTNEISMRIRNYVQGLTGDDLQKATAAYIDYKYLLSFPTRKETIIYDWQRACFMGPWKTPFAITKWLKYYDTNGAEKWLAGSNNGQVYEFSPSYISDNGTQIDKTLRTRRDDAGAFNMMKKLQQVYFLFRNVRGQVNANFLVEDRSGNTVVTKSFSLNSQTASGGWGSDLWGNQKWGETEAQITLSGEELARYANLFKEVRVYQVEITTTVPNSNFEFLEFSTTVVPMGFMSLSTKLKV